ncbi:proteasome assembly chaperone 1 [Pseudomyrmex gracilis]|uniref:proteasome assembly chaperone 1 n=1 Tax=Pseudomyrmex gracilis TaxID=219809 RepID=UPI0009955D40|nr:proteasome assembly chaperone 1 [Pseudomyrmex gracilis]
MVSHFGEVTFPSSRAFWDDEDEYEPVNNSEHCPKLYVNWLQSKPQCIETLILMEGDPLTSFMAQSLCHKLDETCIIENEHRKKVSVIYKIDKGMYLCTFLSQFDTREAGKFIEQLSDLLLSTENTIAIVCRHISQFQSTDIPESSSFLRVLTTKNTKNVAERKIESLEQPNIIFGVGAGVLSYAELANMPATLYVLYVDSFILDSKCIEPILQILPNEICCKLQHPKVGMENVFNKGNLYM